MKDKKTKILKIISISCILVVLLILFAHITNLICSNVKVSDMLFVEGMLLTLLGLSSLFGENINDNFTKEYLKIISSNTNDNDSIKNKEFDIEYTLEPTVDSYIVTGVFILTGILAITSHMFL